MNKPEIIFVAFISGSGGNALASIINAMIDPAFVSEISFSKHGNAHELYDKVGNGILRPVKEINWLLPHSSKDLIDSFVYNEEHIATNPKRYYIMRDHYDVEHLITRVDDGTFNGKIVYLYIDPQRDFEHIQTLWFFKYVVDCYTVYGNVGEYWWRKILAKAYDSNLISKEDENTLHVRDCSATLLKTLLKNYIELGSKPNNFLKRPTEHQSVLQLNYRDLINGNPEILDKLSKFLDLPIPEGLEEKLSLYASLQPSFEKYSKSKGEDVV